MHNVEQTGCCRIVLIKKRIDVSHSNFTRDSTFFATKSVTVILPIVSLRITTLLSIFSTPLSFQDSSPFFKYFQPVSKPNFFQRLFLLLIQLKSERNFKIDFRFFNTQLCYPLYTFPLK